MTAATSPAVVAFKACGTSCAAWNTRGDLWAPWLLLASYPTNPIWHIPSFPLSPSPSDHAAALWTKLTGSLRKIMKNTPPELIQTFLCFEITSTLTNTWQTTSKPAATYCYIVLIQNKHKNTKQNHSKIHCWWSGTNTICTSGGENSHIHYLNKTSTWSYNTIKFLKHELHIQNCISVTNKTMHQNCRTQNETCHHSTVFKGKRCRGKYFM